jgi:hypothetical protein
MSRPVNRTAPVGPVQAYRTYAVLPARGGGSRPASCEEVGCPNYLQGWKTILSRTSQADLIAVVRGLVTKKFFEEVDGDLVTFTFPAGQECFQAKGHKIQVRPERYVVRAGDHRGNPTGQVRVHQRPADWVEDCALHLDKIATEVRRG